MLDGPNEIKLMDGFDIDTWDSSAAIWAGLHQIAFDNSPTGLIDGKFELEVDFGLTPPIYDINTAQSNMKVIDQLCYNHVGTETSV